MARTGRTAAAAAFLAVTASIAVAGTTLAADFDPAVTLRRAAANVPMSLSNIATNGNDIAVAWTDTISPGSLHQYSYIRWSNDGGTSWQPKLALNDGHGAVSAKVGICGGYAWAITSVETGPGTFGIALDGQDLDGSDHVVTQFDEDITTNAAESLDSDFACVGEHQLAAVYSDPSTYPASLMVGVRPLWPCADFPERIDCDPGPSYLFSVGHKRHGETPYIAATNDAIYVAWMKDNGALRFKSFTVALDGTVGAHPTTTLLSSTSASNPHIGAAAKRVVIGYDDGGSRVLVSNDRGLTFGPETILAPEPGGEPQSATSSVAVAGRNILVEIAEGDCVLCYGIAFSRGYLSTDGGATWSTTSSHEHSRQVGAFFKQGSHLRIAEAWDESQVATDHQRIRFHAGTP